MMTTSPSGFSRNSAGSGKGWSVSRMLRGSVYGEQQSSMQHIAAVVKNALWDPARSQGYDQPWLWNQGCTVCLADERTTLTTCMVQIECWRGVHGIHGVAGIMIFYLAAVLHARTV